MNTKPSYGGQALIEGIMMRGPNKIAITVRKPDGTLETKVEEYKNIWGFLAKIPFIRGIFVLVSAMIEGVKAITYSANLSGNIEKDKFEIWMEERFGKNAEGILIALSILMSAAFAFLLFGLAPTLITYTLSYFGVSGIVMSIVEGIFKFFFFIGYILLISKLPEIKRVFQYHGAEHKTLHCYENDEELTVENVRKQSRLHSRCGTSFMFFVLAISIIIFSFVSWSSVIGRVVLKILVFPVVSGVSYELLRFSSLPFLSILKIPGMWIQKITTAEPDDGQIEVAIEALNQVIIS